MALPLEIFFAPDERTAARWRQQPSVAADMHKRAVNAIKKALKEKPVVRKLLWLRDIPLRRYYYSVHSRSRQKHNSEYMILVRNDRDGQWFIECSCPAGNPYVNEHTAVIEWQPKPCYHAAAMLLQFTKTVPATEAKFKQAEARKKEQAIECRDLENHKLVA